MSTLMEFLTSKEVFIVVLIAISICVIGTIYFFIEKVYRNYRSKREDSLLNTTENKIIKIVDNKVVVEPVIPIVEPSKEVNNTTLESQKEEIEEVIVPIEEKKDERLVIPIEEFESKQDTETIETIYEEVKEQVEQNKVQELVYTEIEPNKEQAKEEIRKATEELLRTQELQLKGEIDLTKFEEEQEENAIISLDELYKKSKDLYEKNEITQYEDEGNEPISLADLEQRMNNIKVEINEISEEEKDVKKDTLKVEEKQNTIRLDDFNTIDKKINYQDDKVFKSSPIISPIFGIEKPTTTTDMEFENTANYEKLDDEIKKTNEFLKVLKELQKKLE